MWAPLAASTFVIAACGGSAAPDAGRDASTDTTRSPDARRCGTDIDCDDGLFCNGAESCAPASLSADIDGCVPGAAPCSPGETCEEADELCLSECDRSGDADGDGHLSIDCGGDDCDDSDANRYPGNVEVCDPGSHDEDCNPETFGFIDADMDGAGADHCCNLTADGSFNCGGDCDDSDGSVRPGAGDGPPAACDGLDNDCDGVADEGCPCVEGETRACGASAAQVSGVGACEPGTQICAGGSFTEACLGGRAPAAEVCDGVDNDCDGTIDNGVLAVFYRDVDGDGFGVSGETTEACSPPAGWAANTLDCDDTNPAVSPVGTEVCDGVVDENCDGRIDEGLTHTYYADADGDGFGDRATTTSACFRPDGYVTLPTDCDDGAAAVNPASPEVCDGVDNNCARGTDEGCSCVDGRRRTCGPRAGGALLTTGSCQSGEQFCSTGIWGVCVGSVEPRTEICNGLDDDCDGSVDEGVTVSCYADGDGDGFGTGARLDVCTTTIGACPPGFADVSGDCNESNAAINPGAREICDGMDNDCNGVADTDGAGECVENQILPCATACGSSGTTSCDASCHFRSPGPACAASAEVCNYCDDNLDGTTDDERAIALSSEIVQGMCEQPGSVYGEVGTLYGSASCLTNVGGSAVETSEVDIGEFAGASGLWYDRPATFGYGGVLVDAVVKPRIDAGCVVPDGFAIVLAYDTGSTLGADANLGVPLSRHGIAIEWRTNGAGADKVTLRRLTGAAPGEVISNGPVPVGTRIDGGSSAAITTQIEWSPANALTGEPERIEFRVFDTPTGTWTTVLNTDGLFALGLFTGTGVSPNSSIRMGFMGLNSSPSVSCVSEIALDMSRSLVGHFFSSPTRMTASGQCAAAPGTLRLVGGDGRSGRLEINHGGSWGTVCSDRFGNVDARVACRQLGFRTGTLLPATSVKNGTDPIWMDEAGCTGSEARLDACRFGAASCGADPWGCQNCTHAKDVGVSCVP